MLKQQTADRFVREQQTDSGWLLLCLKEFPETGSGPPNQLGTVWGPSGAGKLGDPQVAGVGVQPPSSVKASCAV